MAVLKEGFPAVNEELEAFNDGFAERCEKLSTMICNLSVDTPAGEHSDVGSLRMLPNGWAVIIPCSFI